MGHFSVIPTLPTPLGIFPWKSPPMVRVKKKLSTGVRSERPCPGSLAAARHGGLHAPGAGGADAETRPRPPPSKIRILLLLPPPVIGERGGGPGCDRLF